MIDISSRRFGKLLALKRSGVGSQGNVTWICKCDCGNTITKESKTLRAGDTISCGCYFLEIAAKKGRLRKTHGKTNTRTYQVWSNMKGRCFNKDNEKFFYYGGRGITVCKRWMKFSNFLADMGEAPDHMTLDRKDVNGNYELSNCHWATQKYQQNNRRNNKRITFNGKTLTLSQWEESIGISQDKLQCRLRRGWSADRALSTP